MNRPRLQSVGGTGFGGSQPQYSDRNSGKGKGGGNDGGDGGGMDPMIERLDNDVRGLQQDLSAVRSDVSSLKAEFDATRPHLATKHDVSTATNKIYGAIAIGVLLLILKDVLGPLLPGA